MRKKVVVLGMGGTISGRASDAMDGIGYTAGKLPVGELLPAEAWLAAALPDIDIVSEQVAQIDSKDMDGARWFRLAHSALQWLSRAEVLGLVVTHGTDTLEETAFFLSAVLPVAVLQTKALVLTGAMRPATSVMADGPQNLRDALTVCSAPGARSVSVVFAGRVHAALSVQKIHPYQLDAFDSGEAGPLGVVEEGVLRLFRPWPCVGECSNRCAVENLLPERWPRVEILYSGPVATGATVRSLCSEPGEGDFPVQGIVVAATGNGSIHQDLEAALLSVHSRGVRVVRASRCHLGSIVQRDAARSPFPHSGGLTVEKARVALMLDLMQSAAMVLRQADTAIGN